MQLREKLVLMEGGGQTWCFPRNWDFIALHRRVIKQITLFPHGLSQILHSCKFCKPLQAIIQNSTPGTISSDLDIGTFGILKTVVPLPVFANFIYSIFYHPWNSSI